MTFIASFSFFPARRSPRAFLYSAAISVESRYPELSLSTWWKSSRASGTVGASITRSNASVLQVFDLNVLPQQMCFDSAFIQKKRLCFFCPVMWYSVSKPDGALTRLSVAAVGSSWAQLLTQRFFVSMSFATTSTSVPPSHTNVKARFRCCSRSPPCLNHHLWNSSMLTWLLPSLSISRIALARLLLLSFSPRAFLYSIATSFASR